MSFSERTSAVRVPVPPAALEEPIYTASTVCTFTGWTPELVAATKTTAYTAQYTRAPRTYTVRFTLGGKTVGEKVLPYGSEITFDRTVDVPAGYNDVLWYGLAETVKGDTVLEGIFTVNDAPSLEYALNSSYISYDPQGDDDNLGDVMNEASALLLLIDESRHNENPIFASRAAEHLRYMISSSGVAPYFDLEPYWNYVHVTAAITLAHETPAVWDQLTSDEQSTYDFIMATFAALLTLGTSDQNDYKTGPGFTGNFNKNWNPNFRLSVVLPMLFAGRYFGGAEKLNQVLASFSYDETVARFAASPCFARAYARWTVEPGRFSDGTKAPNQKTIMENGGPAYVVKYDSAGNRVSITGGDAAGTGQGVRVPYLYQGYTVDNVNSIMTYLIGVNYGGGNVASRMGDDGSGNPLAYILDGTISPVQGMNGMMKEFNSSDAKGLRSSAVYCTADFEMVCAALYCLEELSMYTPDQRDASFKMMVVGNVDLIYKLEHGYRSYSLGKGSDSYEKTSSAYMLWKAWWLNRYGQVDPKKL